MLASYQHTSALDAGADAFALKEDNIAVILARISAMLRAAGDRSEQQGASLQGPKKILAVDDSETYLQQLADAFRSVQLADAAAAEGRSAEDIVSSVRWRY